MRRISVAAAAAVVMAALAFPLPVPPAVAHDEHAHSPKATPPPGAQDVPRPAVPKRLDENEQRKYFTDLPLQDQDGRAVRFYTDMLRGRMVLISFIYTNCTDICPTLMHNLVDVQESLGDRFGKDVFFVSISVDPEDDTPEELKKYAERYEAKPGWTFLTGKKENIDWVVYKLGQYTPDFEDHSMLFLLGDVKNARWAKLKGDADPGVAIAKIREFLQYRDSGPGSLLLSPK
ncbi:MAG: SCO family protein [Deltaproteobacteria bacterium]|nr:SCO family protein [Deltaproteobacteria bacterium]